MSDQEPRSFEDLAQHADIVREEANTAQRNSYITDPAKPDINGIHPSLPGFKGHGTFGLSKGSWGLGGTEWDHIRFLEQAVERLSGQVSELAERLSQQQEA